MGTKAMQSLTSGRTEGTFDQATQSLQNYGFLQTVFEVERLNAAFGGVPGEVIVLRPSATREGYERLRPGDRVLCPGLGHDDAGAAVLCRIRRVAEGLSRRTVTERMRGRS